MCFKIGYTSRSEAQAAMSRMIRVGKRKDGKLGVFRCDLCQEWHWGHRHRPHPYKRKGRGLRNDLVPGMFSTQD